MARARRVAGRRGGRNARAVPSSDVPCSWGWPATLTRAHGFCSTVMSTADTCAQPRERTRCGRSLLVTPHL